MDAGGPIVTFLRSAGAAEHRHAARRSLLDHLVASAEIVERWGQPADLRDAALLHSVYGTDAHHRALLSVERRGEVTALAGKRAERLAFLFGVVPRGPLLTGTYRWARDLPLAPAAADAPPPTRSELDALVLLHMANLADQARAADGSPGRWLARLGRLAELLLDSDTITLPRFTGALMTIDDDHEAVARRSYGAGELALAAATCPVIAEPCIRLAQRARERGELHLARGWASQARRRLVELGTAWDKRHSYEEWLEMIDGLEHDAPGTAPPPSSSSVAPRFQRYLESLAGPGEAAAGRVYPDLPSRPWYEPAEIPLARHLEGDAGQIRGEILALDDAGFHAESERIGRTGHWDVLFLYERGRRHDEVCDRCPVTMRAIEEHGALRTLSGLIYVSRMRPGTHIAAHRGPTNLRLRCHLGISVPDGDCAIRVADETRRWTEGGCLVFDDFFEHEAFNHTDQDRLVLIVDLWHPALAPEEVALLEALQRYALGHARQLHRYWTANARAAAAAPAS